jgi:hypothetical protein
LLLPPRARDTSFFRDDRYPEDSRRLENADFSEKQAEELADILREAVEGDLVTRDYLDARMAEMKAHIDRAVSLLVRWMIGLTIAGVGLAIALARAYMTLS